MPTRSVTRALQAIRRYGTQPEQIDHAILAAINVGLCLATGGNDRVAEGFNHDVVVNRRSFCMISRLAQRHLFAETFA